MDTVIRLGILNRVAEWRDELAGWRRHLPAAVIGLGIVNAVVRGFSIFGLVSLPQFGDPEWRRPLTEVHGLAANLLLGLAVFHAAAALVHKYVWRDGLLGRMIRSAHAPT